MIQVFETALETALAPLLKPVGRWAELSQQAACRNALVASTVLADRRRERIEVAEYLDHALATGPHRAGSASPSLPAARLG